MFDIDDIEELMNCFDLSSSSSSVLKKDESYLEIIIESICILLFIVTIGVIIWVKEHTIPEQIHKQRHITLIDAPDLEKI
jgi:hypothetical protein